MAYCRWSSDDFRSDVYCYESAQGWVIHVANRRYVLPELPPPVDDGDIKAVVDRMAKVSRMIDEADLVPIGLEYDGVSFTLGSPGEAAEVLERLQAAGYHVPQYAIDRLKEEHE